tara:strand:- start:2001 stop:2222 length:222 start_codon:yes stop_codon:yes gene_type:complete
MKLLKEERALLLSLGREINKTLFACDGLSVELNGSYTALEAKFDFACDAYALAKQSIMANHSKDFRHSCGYSA